MNTATTAISGTVDGSQIPPPFTITQGGGGFHLGRGGRREVSLKFAPAAAGQFSGIVTITGTNPVSSQLIVPVNGAGAPGTLTIESPTPINFGLVKVRKRKTMTLTVENTGPGVLHGSVDTAGMTASFNASGARSFTLARGKRRSLSVTFVPPSAGSFSSSLAITSDDPAEPSVDVTLVGIGK